VHRFRVGITGGIAEGKSTVLRYLREAGHRVGSADDCARTVMSDPEVRLEIARIAGLERDFQPVQLRDRLISDVGVRRAVNAAFHPRILAALQEAKADFVEVPLLIESVLLERFEAVWVVTCGAKTQWDRLIERTDDSALSKQLLAIQLPTEAKLPFATVVIRTNAARRSVKANTLEAATQAKKSWVAKHAK
jgi:dephospho-CoA kinase